ALKELGVKTIVSVDGAAPDVEGARKYGMRYVHLPITYSGVDPAQGKAIAKALDELPGPIYVHCHHGKHRSAAAVAVACVYNGTLRPEQATAVLETFGTGANYKGLWAAARDARPLRPEELRDLKIEYVERAKIPRLAEAMVQVDTRWDHLKEIKAAGWKAPKDHPDLDPPHEALQLEELLRELRRTDKTHADKPAYNTQMAAAETATAQLREALKANDAMRAEAAFKAVGASCLACHKGFRD
ncbi:MAG TPA: cytochrome c, partial [Tepidisphaeraceae bacterium]|nr:cytochrome c [Tepidisphaeraceae bacterium]